MLMSLALGVVTLDLVTKILVVDNIAPGQNVRILGGAVYLTQIRNAGAAFSMGTGVTWLLAAVAIGVAIFIIRLAPKLRSTPWAVSLGLILGGAVGNLIDRIFREPGVMRGHVVDFVSVFGPNAEYFPAFNAADSAITIGGVTLVLLAVLGRDFDGRHHRKGNDGSAADADSDDEAAQTASGADSAADLGSGADSAADLGAGADSAAEEVGAATQPAATDDGRAVRADASAETALPESDGDPEPSHG